LYPNVFLFYEITNKPSWAVFDSATGRLWGTPAFGDAGTYSNIRITADDGELTDSVLFSISVAVGNTAPAISGTPPAAANAGAPYTFTPTASDPDGDPLTFSISNMPAWSSFNTTTGELSGTPADTDGGTFSNIAITVTDSKGASASLAAFSITVNLAPTADPGGPYTIQLNESLRFSLTASYDPEGSALTYNWDFGDGATSTLAIPEHTYTTVGSYTVTLVVNDGALNSAPATARVTIVDNYNPFLNFGANSATCNGSNPVNGATGNKYQPETDYTGAGPFPLSFIRHYNSGSPAIGSLGINWRSSYDRSVDATVPNEAQVYHANGNIIKFQLVGGLWQAPTGITSRLESISGGFKFTTNDDLVETYDSSGRLVSIANRAGLGLNLSYNAAGKLETVADGLGRSLIFAYVNDRIQTLTDPAGRDTTYSYDSLGNLENVTYPDGGVRTYLYENATYRHLLTGIIDENRTRFATYGYDTEGRATQSTHAGGTNNVGFVFNADGTTTITDAKGEARTYAYQELNGVLKVSDIAGSICTSCGGSSSNTTYDANGFPDVVTDFNNNITDYDYDARGLEIQRIEAVGSPLERTIITAWHPSYRVPACRTEPNRTTILDYYSDGQLQTSTVVDTSDPALFPSTNSKTCSAIIARGDFATLNKRATNYIYYPSGLLQTIDGPRMDVSDVTNYTYDATGNLTGITNALGHAIALQQYDTHGRPGRMVDPNGLATVLTYDLRGRLDVVTVGGEVTDYDYDPAGNLDIVTLPDGTSLDYDYDAANRLTDIRDQLGNHIHYTLDALGNQTQTDISDPAGVLRRTQSAVYNLANRLEKTVGAANQTTDFMDYDGNGNLKQVRDPGGNNTFYTYDALNRLKTITDAITGVTVYGYDAQDNQVSVQDPRGLTTSYTYDGLGNRTELNSPDTGVTTYTSHDRAGNVLGQTDARNKTTAYTYDALNRIKTITYNDGSTTVYDYDVGANAIGRLSSMTDVTGTTAWSYDIHGGVTSKAQTNAGVTLTTSYTYNSVTGQLETMTTPGGRVINYTYASGQINGINVDGKTVISNISYDPFGSASAWTWGNNTSVTRTSDLDGQLELYTLGDVNRQIEYYPTGNVQNIIDPGNAANNQAFNYDALQRLTNYQGLGATDVYGYDANGNRDALTLGAQNYANVIDLVSNRIDSVGGPIARTYSYDAVGNTLNDGTHSYAYDDRGRLTSVDNGAMTYAINGLGQRIRKLGSQPVQQGDVNGDGSIDPRDVDAVLATAVGTGTPVGTTDCNADSSTNVLDAVCINNLIAATGAGQPLSARLRYAYDEDGQLLGQYSDTGAPIQETIWFNGQPVAVLEGEQMYYVYADHLNTPRAITNQANTTVWSWVSDPFGVAVPNEDPDGDGSPFVYNHRFAGQYYDTETGLHYNYFRYYDPTTGSYITSDPVGLAGGLNTYGYVGGNPLNTIDPYGLDCVAINGSVTCTAPGGGQTVTFPRPDGWPDVINSDSSNYHFYNIPVPLNGANSSCVMQGIINNPTPGSPSAASPQGTLNNATPTSGQNLFNTIDLISSFGNESGGYNNSPVRSYTRNNGSVVVNVTLPGHPLHPGYVARSISGSQVNNYGEGTGGLQGPVSQFFGIAGQINGVWNGQTQGIIGNCGCN